MFACRVLCILSVGIALALAQDNIMIKNLRTRAQDFDNLKEVGSILSANAAQERTHPPVLGEPLRDPSALDSRHGLLHVLEASLALSKKPLTMPGGHMVNELHPPVPVILNRITKIRRIPNHGGEVVRRAPADAKLVAIATTTDMLWLQVGAHEFVLTKDCKLEEPHHAGKRAVVPLHPPLPIHVKEEVTVRKMPDINGKSVGLLVAGDTVSAIGVTPDYAWIQIGHKQFIPTAFAKLGDPTTPLTPPVTIHVSVDSADVRDIPSNEGSVVTTLYRGDVLRAVAVSSDFQWLKISKNNYIPTIATQVGLPYPAAVRFPQPVAVKLAEKVPVVKNPNEPQYVLRTLEKGDEVLAIGSTEDFKWLEVAHHRFIPLRSARLARSIPKPIRLNPVVPIKLGADTPVRHIPDMRGRTMAILKKGDKTEAIGVSADFSWLQLGQNMFIPLASAFFRKADPIMNPIVPPVIITLKTDATVYKRPGDNEKIVKTLPIGDSLTAIATSPDLEWIKIGDKQYIKASTATLIDQPTTTPLFPAVKVVVIRDTKILKFPKPDAMVVHRIKRGETIKSNATTSD